jgi:hypothetical protein
VYSNRLCTQNLAIVKPEQLPQEKNGEQPWHNVEVPVNDFTISILDADCDEQSSLVQHGFTDSSKTYKHPKNTAILMR